MIFAEYFLARGACIIRCQKRLVLLLSGWLNDLLADEVSFLTQLQWYIKPVGGGQRLVNAPSEINPPFPPCAGGVECAHLSGWSL